MNRSCLQFPTCRGCIIRPSEVLLNAASTERCIAALAITLRRKVLSMFFCCFVAYWTSNFSACPDDCWPSASSTGLVVHAVLVGVSECFSAFSFFHLSQPSGHQDCNSSPWCSAIYCSVSCKLNCRLHRGHSTVVLM